jgi:tetrahydromethanopterin S-methyltransferase subunit F
MKTIIESIKYNNGTFPRNEVQQIIERKDEAIPFLLEIVQEGLPGETLDQILGDTITEGSGRMLASVFNGDVQAIQKMVENTPWREVI